ncbi:MAG TPA: Hsp20/alpha crystallin family protein [Trueperaceae bacterium]|nr:Hsp20/alpha crystallin family protein [Trueperaceae bacterium]
MKIEKYRANSDLKEVFDIKKQVDNLNEQIFGENDSVKLDLYDLDNSYQVIIEAAGVEQEDIEIAIQDNELIIAGIRKKNDKNKKLLINERPQGKFQRTIKLPTEVLKERTTAYQKDGLLILNLPKA